MGKSALSYERTRKESRKLEESLTMSLPQNYKRKYMIKGGKRQGMESKGEELVGEKGFWATERNRLEKPRKNSVLSLSSPAKLELVKCVKQR